MEQVIVSDKPVEFGEVVFVHPRKPYGFIEVASVGGKERVYFRFKDGKIVTVDSKGEKLVFTDYNKPPKLHLKPNVGDYIFFLRSDGSKGKPQKASPWVFDQSWIYADDLLKEMNSKCPNCDHLIKEHEGHWDKCMVSNCHCGDEAYRVAPGMEMDNPSVVSTQDSTGGFSICQ